MSPDEAVELSSDGVRLTLAVTLPASGLPDSAAIRDEGSGEMGSAYTFLDVPDFNKNQITLSSIELSNANGTEWNHYEAGSPVSFRCAVFGFTTAARPPQDARVDVQIILFREGDRRLSFDSRIVPVPSASLAGHYLAGEVQTRNLQPGDYAMQLLTWDRLASPKKQLAVRWTQFRVTANRGANQ